MADPRDKNQLEEDDNELLDADDAAEEVLPDGDVPMDSDDEGDAIDPSTTQEEILLENDSIAYFDLPQDSLFSIAQHPLHPSLIAVGGAAVGPDGQPSDDAPGAGWLFDTSAAKSRPVLPPSFASDPESAAQSQQTTELGKLAELDGHTDSITSLAWTLPQGEILVSAGMDGRLRAWKTDAKPGEGVKVSFVGEAQEVPVVNWLAPCPSPAQPNTIAMGASDGSVWVYYIDPTDAGNPLQIVQSYFLHTGECTAGAWTPDGNLLITVAEDSSLYAWDVFGEAAAANITGDNGQSVVAMTGEDQRFEVEGGLYSVAVDPKGGWVAAGGAGGVIKIVSLPRLTSATQSTSQARHGGPQKGVQAPQDPTSGGVILASLHTQSDSVETLSASLANASPATVLLAAGSVDGSICVYDATRRFAVRRNIVSSHGYDHNESRNHAVVRIEFVKDSWTLTSCGYDGVVRRWDLRGGGVTPQNNPGTAVADAGLVKEWKGHRGEGEGGGVNGFVQGQTGERVVTAGDDGLALVFEA